MWSRFSGRTLTEKTWGHLLFHNVGSWYCWKMKICLTSALWCNFPSRFALRWYCGTPPPPLTCGLLFVNPGDNQTVTLLPLNSTMEQLKDIYDPFPYKESPSLPIFQFFSTLFKTALTPPHPSFWTFGRFFFAGLGNTLHCSKIG